MKKKALIVIIVLLIAGTAIVFITKEVVKQKTAYVNIKEVYNGFNLKKELESKYLKVQNERKQIIDSLILEYKYFENKANANKNDKKLQVELESRKDNIIQKKSRFEEDNQALTMQYDKEILTQLSQYIKDYGKQNGYTYIFGTDESGYLLYADEDKNITKQITDYVNNKYSGKAEK